MSPQVIGASVYFDQRHLSGKMANLCEVSKYTTIKFNDFDAK